MSIPSYVAVVDAEEFFCSTDYRETVRVLLEEAWKRRSDTFALQCSCLRTYHLHDVSGRFVLGERASDDEPLQYVIDLTMREALME